MRLSSGALGMLPGQVRRPGYDRSAVSRGIVHLGIGAFHRAHQAVYLDDVLAAGQPDWSIVGASLRSAGTRDALVPQDGLFTVVSRSGAGDEARVVGSVLDVLVAPEETERLIALMAEPGIRIVSLTVTEKGYCHDPATGRLLETHSDIVHDLEHFGRPRSAPGLLVAALARRFQAGIPPFTVMSCDNLPANGRTVKRVLTRLATLVSDDLGARVEGEVACPASMVDRIVPSTTDADRRRTSDLLGVDDAWPVMTEPFSQWVLEDDFSAGRPDFAAVGVQLVADVTPFEHMKLRLLNGSHSLIAYLGYLAGYETVAEAMADRALVRLVRDMMDVEVTPTLSMPAGTDLDGYKDALLDRFANTALRHRTWQIAMDGSQKLPQRLLGTIEDQLRSGGPIDRLSLGVAAWMRYVTGVDEQGRPIDVRDPLAGALREHAAAAGSDAKACASALLGFRDVFPEALATDERFVETVSRHLGLLFEVGARETLNRIAGERAIGPVSSGRSP